MKVRYPKFDFESCFPHWAPHIEFAQINNATSISPCALEPFMIKTFEKAKTRLDPVRDAQLIREVDWFIAQEAQHYRAHARFNRCFRTAHYPEIEGIEKRFTDALEDFLATRSIEFCLAYSEGFESSGAVWYRVWFEEFDRFREGARPEAIALFNWHYAEEYEHREVAFKLYKAVAARGSLWRRVYYGYFYRIWGARFAMMHLTGFTGAARAHLLAVDRAGMTPEERDASIARERDFLLTMAGHMKKGMRGIFSPFYNPAKKRPPRGLDAVLREFEPGGKFRPAPA